MSEHPVICQVVHSLDVGGGEILAREFAARSADEFHTVFACLDSLGTMGGHLRRMGYLVQVLGRRSGFDYGVAHRLARFCRENSVSVIHAHQYAPFFYSALSRFPRRRPPILFTEHGRAFPDYRRPKRVIANKLLIGRRDRIVGVGQDVRRALIENEGIDAERVRVIYNGINLDAYQQNSEDRAEVRRELGLSPTDLCVIQVARLDVLKDHATAILAMARLRQSHSNIRLFVVGDGDQKSAIARMIADKGLQGVVCLLGLRNDVPRLLNGADVSLLTSISEGIPLTIIEAMATGLPCVATDVGGVAEVVVDGETGLLSPAKDDVSIARHVAAMAANGPCREQMGKRGLQRARLCFSDRQMHDNYHQIYCELSNLA